MELCKTPSHWGTPEEGEKRTPEISICASILSILKNGEIIGANRDFKLVDPPLYLFSRVEYSRTEILEAWFYPRATSFLGNLDGDNVLCAFFLSSSTSEALDLYKLLFPDKHAVQKAAFSGSTRVLQAAIIAFGKTKDAVFTATSACAKEISDALATPAIMTNFFASKAVEQAFDELSSHSIRHLC